MSIQAVELEVELKVPIPRGRIAISKRLRFEILRRDDSTCRYCGRSAPNVILEIDHIIPVKLGGTNDLLNLVAACHDCNSGKSARALDDATIQRAQLYVIDDLRSSVEKQAALLIEYGNLRASYQDQIRGLLCLWERLTCESLGDAWLSVIQKWVQLFEFETVIKSIYEAAIKMRPFRYAGSVAAVASYDRKEPGTKRCYLIRGTIRMRFPEVDQALVLKSLLDAMRQQASMNYIESFSYAASSYQEFRNAIGRAISNPEECEIYTSPLHSELGYSWRGVGEI